MGNSKRPSRTRSPCQIYLTNFCRHVLRSTTKFEPTRKLAMRSQGHKVDSSRLPLPPMPALAPAHTLAQWTYLGLGTAVRSEALLPTKKRSAIGTIICDYTVVPPAIGPRNAPINDQGESPLVPLPLPRKEVCQSLLPRLFCLLLPLPLPKSSMRQKTNSRCK